MLAFNLGVFFRNLQGQPMRFSAQGGATGMQFVGGVRALNEKTGLDTQLSVVLAHADLSLHIVFDEGDEDEFAEDPRVQVRLVQQADWGELTLCQTQFAFDEVRLTPAGEEAGAVNNAERETN